MLQFFEIPLISLKKNSCVFRKSWLFQPTVPRNVCWSANKFGLIQNSEGGGDEHTETTRRSTRVKNAPEYLNDFETSSLKKKATSARAPKSS